MGKTLLWILRIYVAFTWVMCIVDNTVSQRDIETMISATSLLILVELVRKLLNKRGNKVVITETITIKRK